jgi:hypothetical protein
MPVALAVLGGAGLQATSSLAGGKKGASAATQAANIQAATARQALALEQAKFQTTQQQIQPFLDFGTGQLPALGGALQNLTSPIDTSLPQFTFQPTAADLAQTPGYQFTLQQGLEAEQARINASGLGSSGSAIRGAGQYAAGLASQTWPQVFQAKQSEYQTNINSLIADRTMNLQQRQQIINQLMGGVNVGQQAAGTLAGVNTAASQQQASTITGIGAAQASGVVGSANALVGGLQGVGSAAGGAASNLALINALQGPGTSFNVPPGYGGYSTAANYYGFGGTGGSGPNYGPGY